MRRLLAPAALITFVLSAAPAGANDNPLRWSDCDGGFQSATVTVPLDYDRRSRGTLDVPVIRIPATDPGRRIGSLFVHFGGPARARPRICARGA